MKSPITTHVLDTSTGKPAGSVNVILERQQNDGTWSELSRGATNEDGRIADLLPDDATLAGGVYRLVFLTGDYFKRRNIASLYPRVTIEFFLNDESHYHIPLLLSPYGYTTYRGS